MKLKVWVASIVLGSILIYMMLSGLFIFRDILFLYLLVLIPTLVVLTIEYLIRKKTSYKDFLKGKVFGHLLTSIFIFGFFTYNMLGKSMDKSAAIQDLIFMVESLENIHPDIYHLISKDSFLLAFNHEIDGLPETVSELAFYKVCARLTSHFMTGHTKPLVNLGAKFPFARSFPFETKIIDDRLYVIHSASLFNSVPVGSEIIEINNKSISQVIDEWSKLVSYENNAFRNYLITNPMNIGVWNDFKTFKIKYINYENEEIKTISVNGSAFSNIYNSIATKNQKSKDLLYTQIAPEVGYIGFFSCMDIENYKDFFRSSFEEIKEKEIKHVIIDIRENGGGYSVIADDLMQYIFHQPHQSLDSGIVKVSKELMATGKVKDKLWNVKDPEVGKTYTRVPGLKVLKDNPLRFQGKAYLLINNGTFSAAQGFASAYRCYGEGTIIGEETGGVTVNFGDVHIFELPNSGMKIMTSWE